MDYNEPAHMNTIINLQDLHTQGKHEKLYVSFSVEAFILFVRHTCSSVHPKKSQIINPEVKLLNVN